MDRSFLLWRARRARGLTQAELAARSGTSQATLSAYERGLKSPSLKVASRILAAMDHELTLRTRVDWVEHHPKGIVKFWAPSMLWAVEPPTCLVTVHMPDQIRNTGMSHWNLRDREERRGAYEQLIRRGLPQQMIRWIDGGLLIDLWDELDLPDPVREAWEPAIRLATLPLEVDGLRFFFSENPDVASTARAQGYEPLPKSPPPPPPRRSRFDPRPPLSSS
ncbi:helix-turn-helix domain-containing protein [Sinomonas sp. G460-2]|uniref:helix-turn-helix domain-containing protein n=1 Tax=Sinomonas sp. G460-2 TaxID=3393464 RepID=UPI0039EF7470